MSHRIDVELTSRREDGSWTWRAAGARQPKGVVDASVVPDGVSVGDVVRADAEMGVDGTQIVAVKPPAARERPSPERIELLGSGGEQSGVTTQLAKGRRSRNWDDDSGGGGRRDRRDRRRPSGGAERRGGRPGGGDRRGAKETAGRRNRGRDTTRSERPRRQSTDTRPRPPRLRPAQTHRKAFLALLPDDQQPLAKLVVRGGVPLVRETLANQRKAAEEQGIPPVKPEPVIEVAEKLAPHARLAEWMDRADAALRQADDVDLRDLRSVVVAADGVARHEQTRELADQLRAALTQRVDTEQRQWLDELGTLVGEERAIAALRLSSRPPKAGAPLPAPLAASLAALASSQLTADTSQDRYAAVVDALAYAPVRAQVAPQGVPAQPGEPLVAAVTKLGDRVPGVAAAFGLATPPPAKAAPQVPPPPAPSPAPASPQQVVNDETAEPKPPIEATTVTDPPAAPTTDTPVAPDAPDAADAPAAPDNPDASPSNHSDDA